jgi:hypothetical protein
VRPGWECPFWRKVDDSLHAETSLRLGSLDLESDDPQRFRVHNTAFFEAVRRVTGRSVIVDSSKDADRLDKLLGLDSLDVRPVGLVRSPFGVVYSNLKKERGVWHHSVVYGAQLLRLRRALAASGGPCLRYEELCRDPAAVIAPLMERLGLRFEPEQLAWAGRERHNLGGNRMRFATESAIRLDEQWRAGLTPSEKLVIAAITSPARFLPPALNRPFRWVYRRGLRLAGPDA